MHPLIDNISELIGMATNIHVQHGGESNIYWGIFVYVYIFIYMHIINIYIYMDKSSNLSYLPK